MKTSISTKKWLLIFLTLLTTAFFVTHIINIFLADAAYARGETFKELGFYDLAITKFNIATQLNYYEPRYHRQMAYTYTLVALETKNELTRNEYMIRADKEAQIAYRLNPQNSLTLRSIINTYLKLAQIDKKYQEITEELIQEAIHLIPTDPVLRYLKGKIYIFGGKEELALNYFDAAINLKPDYHDAKYAKGLSLATLSRYKEAVEIFEEIGETEKAKKYRNMIH